MTPTRLAVVTLIACAAFAGRAVAQTTQPVMTEIDACGVLVRSGNCVLFQAASGKYYIPDYGKFKEGDAVRVVGTADPSCVTICSDADGCIRGGVLYDPTVFPCGTPINVPFDPCSGLSLAALAAATFGATWAALRASRRERIS